jgi:hypothetical protein
MRPSCCIGCASFSYVSARCWLQRYVLILAGSDSSRPTGSHRVEKLAAELQNSAVPRGWLYHEYATS